MIMLVTIIAAGFVIWLVGWGLKSMLGWPIDQKTAARWGLVLLATAVIFAQLPQALEARAASAGTPAIHAGELASALLLIGLAVLGYVGWNKGAEERAEKKREATRTRFAPRERVPPPAPAADEDANGFEPVGEEGDDDAPPAAE